MDTAAPSSQQKWALPVEPWTLCNPVALETLSRGFILIDNLWTVERQVRPSTSEIAGTCGGLILLDRGRQNPTLCNRPSFHGYRLTECADNEQEQEHSESAAYQRKQRLFSVARCNRGHTFCAREHSDVWKSGHFHSR